MPEPAIDRAWGFAWRHRGALMATFTVTAAIAIGLPLGVMEGEVEAGVTSGMALVTILEAAAAAGIWLDRRRGAGLIVMDYGNRPLWILWSVLAILGPLGLYFFPDLGRSLFGLLPGAFQELLWALCCLSWSLYSIALALGRLQIHDNGISFYGSFLKWDEIKSYGWEGEKHCELRIEYQNQLSLYLVMPQSFPVASNRKNSVDGWLSQYCRIYRSGL